MDTLIDSNVLIRAHDYHAEPYARAAIRALDELSWSGGGALSAQSLGEFATYATLHLNLPRPLLLTQLAHLIELFPVLPITANVVTTAVRIESRRYVGHYEAQVRAVAQENGLKYILTEDRPNRWHQDGIHYLNLTRHAPTGGWRPVTGSRTAAASDAAGAIIEGQ